MSEHTPTPWMVDPNDPSRILMNDSQGDVEYAPVAAVITSNCDPNQWQADAQFIVHAINCHDDLLSVAQRLASWNGKGNPSDLINQACEAIAKAEGRTNGR